MTQKCGIVARAFVVAWRMQIMQGADRGDECGFCDECSRKKTTGSSREDDANLAQQKQTIAKRFDSTQLVIAKT